MHQVGKLLKAFEKRANEWPFEELVAAIRADPAFPEAFAHEALISGAPAGTYFDLVLSHVPERAFSRLIDVAVERLGYEESDSNPASVIAYSSLQCPHLLHPHLPRIFAQRANLGSYYEPWPWRESWASSRDHLLANLRESLPEDDRRRAWDCLRECRTVEALRLAVELGPAMSVPQPAEVWLPEVGFDADLRQLYRNDCRHLIFTRGYIQDDRPVWNDRTLHPTWQLQSTGDGVRFGGTLPGACGLCAGKLHHLVTLPELNASFATCLSCLGWEQQPLFYRHDSEGAPTPLNHGSVLPQFPSEPIVETTVRLAPTPARWYWQDWALSNSRENLFRLGGYPSWIQNADYPRCPDCANAMGFLMQLDSDLPLEDGSALYWGSGGIGYVFWCGACRTSAVSEQHT